jgi:hypothetical protein
VFREPPSTFRGTSQHPAELLNAISNRVTETLTAVAGESTLGVDSSLMRID